MRQFSNLKLLLVFSSVVFAMSAFAYVNVPLFKMYCQKVGIAISPNAKSSAAQNPTDREVTILFTGVVAGNMPMAFKADRAFETIHLGESSKTQYHFVNLSDDTIYFRPVHSVLPEKAAAKLTLTKCFCFDDQTILPHQSYSMPVVFSFASDLSPEIERITFHYTLFKKDSKPTP
jgi:cytochrome c oxidase assembly protein subunit 11